MSSIAVRRTAAQSTATLPAPIHNSAGHIDARQCAAVQGAAWTSRAVLHTPVRHCTEQCGAFDRSRRLLSAAHCSSLLADVRDRSALPCGRMHRITVSCTAGTSDAPHRTAQKYRAVERVALHALRPHRTKLQHSANACTAMHRVYSTAISWARSCTGLGRPMGSYRRQDIALRCQGERCIAVQVELAAQAVLGPGAVIARHSSKTGGRTDR